MIVRFTQLLPEYVPHVKEIGRCMGCVVVDSMVPDDVDCTITQG